MTDSTPQETDKKPEITAQIEQQAREDVEQAEDGDRWEHPGVGKIPGARSVR